MVGTINLAMQATYTDNTGVLWTYFQDNDAPSVYYIVPRPVFSIPQNGVAQFHLTEWVDGNGEFLSAQCQLATMLTVPDAVIQAVGSALQQKGVAEPNYQAINFLDITKDGVDPNQAFLNYADAGGMFSRTVATTPSLSGNQTAAFNLSSLTQSEVNFFKAYFSGATNAGSVQVSYQLTALARLGTITARVQFDSQAAFNYQRTYKWVRS
ncbi:hypothetical protein NIES4101_26000 (plasmid) [Calothrix sp. NIES-4101]|nr:hypothetical protein NIES4101_26000 [Calothrix sp. NIES-4101]